MSASNIANMLYIRVIVFTVNDGRGGAYVIEKKSKYMEQSQLRFYSQGDGYKKETPAKHLSSQRPREARNSRSWD